MEDRHILDLDQQNDQLIQLFESIRAGNTILFLGAGASIGEKKYLSRELIEYYEAYLGKQYNENNITRFLDILSADPEFSRKHFDDDVEKILRKYDVTDGHKTLASIPWREIITTNFDLLVEQAFDRVKSTANHTFDLHPIRDVKSYNYRTNNSEVKYIKLNGCISDKGKYPLAFSSDDFNKLKTFYRVVLNDLRNLSEDVSFISIGYSFSDDFGKQLLEKFDSYNFRDRKWIYNIDPFPNENALHYYSQQRIAIVKTSFQDFFQRYKQWESSNLVDLVKRKRLSFTNSKESQVYVPPKTLINLDGVIRQLNTHVKDRFIKDVDYYRGEEPNYDIITREVDVVKKDLVSRNKQQILEGLGENHSPLLPIFFITGGFGIGKSTYTLRLIRELSKDVDLDLVAFEIVDFQKLNKDLLIELFTCVNSKNIVLFCDEVEVESSFKALLTLQRDLSIEQFNDSNIFFLVPIRENILAKYKLQRDLKKAVEIELDSQLNEVEIGELVVKLRNVGLINYRDEAEKRGLLKKIQKEYHSDSFISLMQLVTDGNHVNDLIGAYHQLSKDCQSAFLYVALMHKYQLHIPASWLKNIISLDWNDFIERIVKSEGKGILIQDHKPSYGTNPDLFFKTKHPIIANKLIEKLLPTTDKQYNYYERIFKTVELGLTNSFVAINLLKALVSSEDFSQPRINKLYDLAYAQLSDDPYFLLNYCINLQYRNDVANLKKALDLLVYAESLLEKRNHKFVHRRAVINFELAKKYYDKEDQLNFTITYLSEAKELFVVKQFLDPFSAYSYVDYIKLVSWELKNIDQDEEDKIQKRIQIEELFDLADKTVTDGVNRLHNVKMDYANYLKQITNDKSYKEHLDDLYSNQQLRPYACILLYNYFSDQGETQNLDQLDSLIEEMSDYQENGEVVRFLLKYYGRRLHILNNRMKFFTLCRENPFLEKENPARFNYFKFIAESYNHNFGFGKEALNQIKSKYNTLNPEFHYLWLTSDGEELIFDAQVIKRSDEKWKAIKVSSLQQTFKLVKGNYDKYLVNQYVKVKLHFYLYGIMAEIVQ